MAERSPSSVPIPGRSCDILIAGAGPAGVAAAIAASRRGFRVLLLDAARQVGGTVVMSLIHTLGGLYDDRGALLNQGLSDELCHRLQNSDPAVGKRKIGRTWCLEVDPNRFGQALGSWLAEEANITLLLESSVICGIVDGDTTFKLKLLVQGQPVSVAAKAVIDATGAASLVRILDPSAVVDPPERVAAGLICRLRCCDAGALAFPRGVDLLRSIRQAASAGELPPVAGSVWLDKGLRDDEVFAKLTLPLTVGTGEEIIRLAEVANQARLALIAFLHRFPAFRQAVCEQTGQIGLRDGARIKGEACLSEADVLTCRIGPDTACLGAWPVEYWDREHGVELHYLPTGGRYGIPRGCLRVAGHPRLWSAGKCLSAEPRAQASARVTGCCWAMGEATGNAILMEE